MIMPGSYQSMNEIEAIFKHPQFHEQLGAYPMTEIRAIETGYVIYTLDREIWVDVRHIHRERCGPIEFELIVHDPIMKQRPQVQDFALEEVQAGSQD